MKKRIISIILLSALVISALNIITVADTPDAPEASGTVLGHYYTSNIRAFLNYKPIKSYNIGGRTLISVEDFKEHGFTVYWSPDVRVLQAQPIKPYPADEGEKDFGAPEGPARSGRVAGNYYSTDIRTFVNNTFMESYNIGGRTLVFIEDLQYVGFNVYWNSANRTIAANIRPPLERDVSGARRLYVEYFYTGQPDSRGSGPFTNFDADRLLPERNGPDITGFLTNLQIRLWIDGGVLDEHTRRSIGNKFFFPIFNEHGEDVSHHFNYEYIYHKLERHDGRWDIFELIITRRPDLEALDKSIYLGVFTLYVPWRITNGMEPSLSHYWRFLMCLNDYFVCPCRRCRQSSNDS